MIRLKNIIFVWPLLVLFCCSAQKANAQKSIEQTADRKATKETRKLYKNLHALWGKAMLFGHQDDLAYGVGWKYEAGRSDVKELTGDYPALIGWDAGGMERSSLNNIDGIPFKKMKQYIIHTYQKGGVTTLSWHMDNPYTGKNAWDTTSAAIPAILPGGKLHAQYKASLDVFARYMHSLKDTNGIAIPILFRPFHECTGSWFWWGAKQCTPAQFKLLFQFTVNYLREDKKVHNLIYVFNPADFDTPEAYLERYPGDEYVDVLSFDTYQYGTTDKGPAFREGLRSRLKIQEQLAEEHHKIAAIGETGYVEIPDPQWWTNILWESVKGFKVSYVLVWRNAGYRPVEKDNHYYAPYKGQVSAANFLQFYRIPEVMFLKKARKSRLYH